MRDAGILTIYNLIDTSKPGDMPNMKLAKVCDAYYSEVTMGVSRFYSALSAGMRIDAVVRCFNTDFSADHAYVILEDGKQYRVEMKQKRDDHVDLTLMREASEYDVTE